MDPGAILAGALAVCAVGGFLPWVNTEAAVVGAALLLPRGVLPLLVLGAAGIQMGTRFLATKESDFAELWKQGIVKAGDRGTLVARGFVGPARWIKTPASLQHQKNTLEKAPGVFLGTPDDGMSQGARELMDFEKEGIDATFAGDESKALYAGGECAQRINDMPTAKELVDRIVAEARQIIQGFPQRYV